MYHDTLNKVSALDLVYTLLVENSRHFMLWGGLLVHI